MRGKKLAQSMADATDNLNINELKISPSGKKIKKRIYGLDFLRIFAMFLVVLDHVVISNQLGPSSAFHNSVFTVNNALLWMLFIVCIWCNVLFGMVSGYLMYDRRPKAHRVFSIWLETFFYSVVCFLLLLFAFHVPFSKTNLLNAIFPIMRVRYWYLTAYFEMLLFVPLLNIIVRNISEKTALAVMILFFVFILVIPLFLGPSLDSFSLLTGKNAFGLMIFYLLGAWLRKFKWDQIFSKRIWALIAGASLLIAWLAKIGLVILDQKTGLKIDSNLLNKNTSLSPLALVGAFAFFCLFKNVHFSKSIHPVLKTLSAASLSVYLIHWALMPKLQYLIMISGRDRMNPILLLVVLLGMAIILDLCCSLVDCGRMYLFKLLHCDNLAKAVGKSFDRIIASIHALIQEK